MIFDLRTCDAAYNFVLEFLNISGEKFIADYIVECESNIETLWEKYFDMIDAINIQSLKIMAFHVTTTSDNCEEIKRNGLQNLQKVLSGDTILNQFLRKYGIKLDIPNRRLLYEQQAIDIDYDKYRGRAGITEHEEEIAKIARRVFFDPCVNGFMVRDNVFTYSTIHKYPEFISILTDAFPKLQPMKIDWTQQSKTYKVDFYTHYRQVQNITFDLGGTQYSPKNIYQELTYEQTIKKWLLYRAVARVYDELGDVVLCVKDDVDIIPAQIISYTPIFQEDS